MKKRTLKNRILALATCTLVLIGSLMLPIGATENEEDVIIKSPYQSNFQSILETTPGCNLITMPYKFSQDATYEIDDLTIITHHNGSLTLNGYTNDFNDYYTYIELAHVTLKKGQYFLSGYFGEYASHLYVSSEEEVQYWICNENGTLITINNASLDVEIGLCIEADEEFNDVNIQPMLTKGNTQYPYQPYLPYLFGYELGVSAGYSNGYAEGQQVGKNEGYNTGYDQGYTDGYNEENKDKNDIFAYATYNGKIYYNLNNGNGQTIKNISFKPTIINSGIYFEPLLEKIYEWSEATWNDNLYILNYIDYVYVEIKWATHNAVNYNVFPIYITGDSDVSSGTIKTIDNKTYTINAEQYGRTDEEGKANKTIFKPSLEIDPLIINYFAVHVGRPEDLLRSFYLYSESEFYNNGYNDGYTTGLEIGEKTGYVRGQNTGYNNGFTKGKEEGLKITESGSWTNLFTAVAEAPINTFQSLFNFQILGLDMRVAFGAIMSICVILIIIKKVIL